MYLNKLPALVALPLMAFLIALISGMPLREIASNVISDGAVRLSVPIVTVMIGSMLSQFVSNSKIAESMIKKIAEYSGDNPIVATLVSVAAVSVLFSVLGGLGSVIMVASIALPIMLSIGLSRITAASIFLMALGLGGIFNLTNWQLYITVLGLSQKDMIKFAVPLSVVFAVTIVVFLLVEMRLKGLSKGWDIKSEDTNPKNISFFAMLTPIIPIVIVFGFTAYNILFKPSNPFEFPIIAAMLVGLAWGYVFTFDKDKSLNILVKSVVEGIGSVGPAVAIIMGIGMLLNSVSHPAVFEKLLPLISRIIPDNPIKFVLAFSVLSPLTLYRGPLNIWGMGAGLVGIILSSKMLTPFAIMVALMSVGQIQGVCDPTNTHNVWIANYLDLNTQDILKKTIPYMWIVAALGLIIGAVIAFQ